MPPPQCRTVYRDYDARNDTKHHERQRLTNAGERGERKGDGDGGGRRSDTVVVVGSRYADTFAGCERPGQRRVNWRGVPSRDSHHDPAPPSREFSCAATSSCYLFNVVKEVWMPPVCNARHLRDLTISRRAIVRNDKAYGYEIVEFLIVKLLLKGGCFLGNCALNVSTDVRIKYWGEKLDYTRYICIIFLNSN